MRSGLSHMLRRVEEILRESSPLGIAVSGGIDSRVLASIALRAGMDATCVFFKGRHLSPAETRWADQWFRSVSITPLVIRCSPLSSDGVERNPHDRCYHCKLHAMSLALKELEARGIHTLAEGSNKDDMASYRPGTRALQELGVLSPLAVAGMGKQDIRAAARELGLAWPDQPSRACLLTRFPYGHPLDSRELELIGSAEDELAALGLGQFRLRLPEPGRPFLHVAKEERDLFSSLETQVRKVLDKAFPSGCEVAFLDSLSGFYDNTLK